MPGLGAIGVFTFAQNLIKLTGIFLCKSSNPETYQGEVQQAEAIAQNIYAVYALWVDGYVQGCLDIVALLFSLFFFTVIAQ